ncbi:MAG: CDP-alcohol phosphatidyltransferase family protein [Clostridia bacterium]|nr:CDP-alcohol phosphatidyltransferase family protein [Clostridia bacterium]
MSAASIPNIITSLRIAGTFGLIFTPEFDVWFYVLYIFTGITDILDGFVARKLKVTSEFGARLDSVSDLFFYVTILCKIFRKLQEILHPAIWVGAGAYLVLRVISYIIAAVKFHKLASLHTYLNKIGVFLVFLVPLLIHTEVIEWLCAIIAIVGIIATIEEIMIHIRRKEYATDIKDIKSDQ